MILSMTGFGKAITRYGNTNYTVELRSLNSKATDIRCKLPAGMADREMQLRKIITDGVVRGRIEVFLDSDSSEGISEFAINKALFKTYYNQLNSLREELGVGEIDLFSAVMRIPSVISSEGNPISDEEWNIIEEAVQEAITQLSEFRMHEGRVLATDLAGRIAIIESLIPKLEPLEVARMEKQKDKLRKNLEDFILSEKVDQNRFEQELIYYMEKMDITEEKIRLAQHCQYFKDQLNNENQQVGKILSFISQEIGREINTLGSKAQDSEIQQIVVVMKDELEKIKEQLANIL